MSEPAPSTHSEHSVEASTRPPVPATPWARIKEHKIIQWGVGYLAAALALTHAEELIARAFDWPEFVSRALIVVLALGLPIAITLAWYHGHRASRHVTGAEATIIAILLLVGAGFLWVFVGPHDAAVTQSVGEHAAAPTTSPVPSATGPLTSASSAAPLVPAPASGKPRIAILPFTNLSPDPKDAFFTDGLHEEILATLTQRAPGLEVISSTTMLMYRQKPKPVIEMAKELGATHVIEGSVQRAGNRVRLTLQLIAARTDDHIWAQDYTRTLTDALTLQSDVANEVASQLSLKLSEDSQRSRAPTRSAQAYDLYLKALLRLRGLDSLMDEPLTLLTQALVYDPDFALAYAQRARTRTVRYAANIDVSEDNLRAIREDLAASQRLAPNDPTVLYARAFFEEVDEQPIERVLASFRMADAAGGAEPVWLTVEAIALLRAGRLEEGSHLLQRAIALDPGDQTLLQIASTQYVNMRRPAEALRVVNLGIAEFQSPTAAVARAYILNVFTGAPLPASLDLSGLPPPIALEATSEILRLAQRYRDIENLIAGLPYTAFPASAEAGAGLGMRPTAELMGWLQLLLGNRALTIKAGREVLDFAARQRATRRNIRLLQLLSAEGSLFTGNVERARTTARAAAAGPVDEGAIPVSTQIRSQSAQVLAWAGAADEATAILEDLSVAIPGLAPGQIARDPLYTVPLAGNARYKALQAKLEAQMAATKLE